MATYQHFEVGWTSTNGFYIPADFDPKKLKFVPKPRSRYVDVRNMLPHTMQCTHCGHFVGAGTKFNMRGEKMRPNEPGAQYLELVNMKFTFRCPTCKHALTFRTDYENDDYVCVEGCRSGKEIWFRNVREESAREAEVKEKQSNRNAPDYDAIAELERKAKEQERSMDMADSVNELLDLQKAQVRPDTDAIIEQNRRKRRLLDESAIEAEFEAHKAKRRKVFDRCRDDGFDWEDGVPKLRGVDMFAAMKEKKLKEQKEKENAQNDEPEPEKELNGNDESGSSTNGTDTMDVDVQTTKEKKEKKSKKDKKKKKKKKKMLVNPFQKNGLYGDQQL